MRRALVLGCAVVLLGFAAWAQPAEWTIWPLEPDSFPGELHWSDGELFVSLQNPSGIALVDEGAGTMRVWELSKAPGEFEIVSGRALHAIPYAAEIGWLNLEYGMLSFFPMPHANAWPVQLLDGGASTADVDLWYLDWNNGSVGRFSPFESGPFDVRDLTPSTHGLMPVVLAVNPIVENVTSDYFPYNVGLVPPVSSVLPTMSDPFTEWPLFLPGSPAFGFARSSDGRIWVSGDEGDPLQALSPWSNTVTTYDLPGSSRIGTLVGGDQGEVAYLAYASDGIVTLGVIEGTSGDVSLWTIHGASDPVGLRMIDGALWFCDRGVNAIARFNPESATVTWWPTGGDDGPLYLESGANREIWVSFERSGSLARLRLAD